ncbi:hypothetical protein MBLNU459_g1128t1 [Dothideomycetes sp. NU459]
MAAAGMQTLLRFLTRDAKLPLATAMGKVRDMQHAQIATSNLDTVKSVFADEKLAKQILAAARRTNKKRAGGDDDSLQQSRNKRRRNSDPDGLSVRPPAEVERALELPTSTADETELSSMILSTNRAPLVLAFAVTLLKYTMPEQPPSSRLSLAQAVVSMNSRTKAYSIGIGKDEGAEREGWGQGQPVVRVMGREVRVLKRWGYDWRSEVEMKDTGVPVLKHGPNNSTGPISAGEDESPPLWAIDLEQLKQLNGPLIFNATTSESAKLPIYSPRSAHNYLSRAFANHTTSENGKKSITGSKHRALLERNLGSLLKALDLLYQSWSDGLPPEELDTRAWSCAVDIATVKSDVTHYLNFCVWYLSAPRTRSPIPGMTSDSLLHACVCIQSSGVQTSSSSKKQRTTSVATNKKLAVASSARSTCNTAYVKTVRSEFKYPSAFCTFFNAWPRTTSPVSGMLAADLLSACNCVIASSSTVSASTSSSTTIKSSSRSQTTSKKTSQIPTSIPACGGVNQVVKAFAASSSAVSFCSSFLSIPASTALTIVTSTTQPQISAVVTGTNTAFADASTIINAFTTHVTSWSTVPSQITIVDATSTVTADAFTINIPTTVTYTSRITTTSDDMSSTTTSATPIKRDTLPSQVATLPSSILSSACSCLPIPKLTRTLTSTVLETVISVSGSNAAAAVTVTPLTTVAVVSTAIDLETQISTQTIDATAMTSYVPTSTVTTTATAIETDTSEVLKSDVISSIVAIVSGQSMQPFCSSMLDYTTPTMNIYETVASFLPHIRVRSKERCSIDVNINNIKFDDPCRTRVLPRRLCIVGLCRSGPVAYEYFDQYVHVLIYIDRYPCVLGIPDHHHFYYACHRNSRSAEGSFLRTQ